MKKISVAILVLIIIICCVSRNVSERKIKLEQVNKKETIQRAEESETNTDTWDLETVNIVYDTDGVAVPVPKGYVASGADGEHTVSTGFVIYEGEDEVTNDNAWEESKSRNQWVWIPVSDSSRIYTTDSSGKKKSRLYSFYSSGRSSLSNSTIEPAITATYDKEANFEANNLQGVTRDEFLEEIQLEFEKTIESIEKYGGFYIGRYETGNLSSDVPVIKRLNTGIASQNWYKAYSKLKLLGANDNVGTNMIWGCLWDETLQWLVDSGAKTYSEIAIPTGWGNFRDAEIEYTLANGNTATKAAEASGRIPTGSTEIAKANNIYDLAGNVWEWTMEGYSNSARRFRGNSYYYYSSSFGAGYRNQEESTFSNSSLGFRAYMYIK